MDDDHSDEDLIRENELLQQELILLGRDPAVFAELLPDEMNLRLKKAIAYAEEMREAELLGREPPPAFLDPTSPHWIPDVDDMVHRTAQQQLGDDFILLAEEALTDAEVEEQLHLIIDRLADRGVAFGINETVPERLAYRYLLQELREGLDVMPGWVLDGCDGSCEECFQLPYCESGKQLAAEYRYHVPEPPIPARTLPPENPASRARSYDRMSGSDVLTLPDNPDEATDFGDDIPF